jgi:hypothetical protein
MSQGLSLTLGKQGDRTVGAYSGQIAYPGPVDLSTTLGSEIVTPEVRHKASGEMVQVISKLDTCSVTNSMKETVAFNRRKLTILCFSCLMDYDP